MAHPFLVFQHPQLSARAYLLQVLFQAVQQLSSLLHDCQVRTKQGVCKQNKHQAFSTTGSLWLCCGAAAAVLFKLTVLHWS